MISLSLKDKVVVVTGGTQGVGEAIARATAEAGAAGLCITGRNKERGDKVAADISKKTPTIFVQAELGDEK